MFVHWCSIRNMKEMHSTRVALKLWPVEFHLVLSPIADGLQTPIRRTTDGWPARVATWRAVKPATSFERVSIFSELNRRLRT